MSNGTREGMLDKMTKKEIIKQCMDLNDLNHGLSETIKNQGEEIVSLREHINVMKNENNALIDEIAELRKEGECKQLHIDKLSKSMVCILDVINTVVVRDYPISMDDKDKGREYRTLTHIGSIAMCGCPYTEGPIIKNEEE